MHRFSRLVGLAIVLLLIAQTAWGTTTLSRCSNTDTITDTRVDDSQCIAWRFTAADEDSPGITIGTESGQICFDPDTASTGTGTAQVMIRRCLPGYKPTLEADWEDVCPAILDTPLTGLPGASGTQNMCVPVQTGTYFSEVTTAPSSEASVVYFQGNGE